MPLRSTRLAAATVISLLMAVGMQAPAVAGHDSIVVNPALMRFHGRITEVGPADAQGRVLTFEVSPMGPGAAPPLPDQMVGWRLIVLTGQRFASAYEVRSNTRTQVTVAPRDATPTGTLAGIKERDIVTIEEPDPNPPPADGAGGS